jgi:threonine aldolase
MVSSLADFRSDTVTRPTPAMRDAMARAEVGDDVMGEDPTVALLEAAAAQALGKPAALFVPSGTMANQIAVHVHCRPGDELICEARSHVYFFEGGSVARLSGTQVRPLVADDGFPTPAQIEAAIRPDDVHFPRTRLLVLEDTHNMAGGRVAGPQRLRELAAAAHRAGLSVHIDGARLANAAVAAGCPLAELAAPADSVSLCLSKGLGAPVGSVVAGSSEFVAAARRVRKAFGGGMRQAGVIAAAGLLALQHGPQLLVADHARARRLAQALAPLPGLLVDVGAVETNIVMLDLQRGSPVELVAFLRQRSVLAAAPGPMRVRFVTHRDVGDADVDACIAAVTAWTQASAKS